jgi:hypothetical protein
MLMYGRGGSSPGVAINLSGQNQEQPKRMMARKDPPRCLYGDKIHEGKTRPGIHKLHQSMLVKERQGLAWPLTVTVSTPSLLKLTG